MDDAYGIDFGTTNSVLARATASTVETVRLDGYPAGWEGTGLERVLPSVIGFDGARPVFGWAAKQRPEGKLEAVKRLFATEDTVRIGERELRVEEAAAAFFRHLQQRAAASGLMKRLDQAVVTIPANSRGRARQRTKVSASLAGIQVMALINEPTAAAMAYARVIARDQRIMVFDWGGGTLDVTVLESFDRTFIEQASKGIQRLGGIDIDNALYDAVLPRVSSGGWGPSEHAIFRLNLEQAKIKLSTVDTVPVDVPGGGGTVPLTREELERVARPLVERTREPVRVCLDESPGPIHHLVMVGGSSKMPAVRQFISELVGVEPGSRVDPMTAVAEGAAIAAGVLRGSITDIDFHVATEHALGTVVHNDNSPKDGEFSMLIRRNTKYPARAADTYTPVRDQQEQIVLQVIEGDPAKPIGHEDNVVLKDWTIDLPEKRSKEQAAFEVEYEYDLDGILHVTLTDQLTGRVFMKEELAAGADGDRQALAQMRQRLDALMGGAFPDGAAPAAVPAPSLSPRAAEAVRNARTKVLPFVTDADQERLAPLLEAVEAAPLAEQEPHVEALERELRIHAYLL